MRPSSSELRTALEFHDSTLIAISRDGDRVVAQLDTYLHRSVGRPGVDPGTGWQGTVRLSLSRGEAQGTVEGRSLELWDGSVEVGGEVMVQLLPIPSSVAGPVRVTLESVSGDRITLVGNGLEAELVGEAVYVDAFPGAACK